METLEQIKAELKKRGYRAKIDGSLVVLDLNPDLGHSRSYVIEKPQDSGKWEIFFTEVIFDEDGEDNEEQYELGQYDTAVEIAEAVDENENE